MQLSTNMCEFIKRRSSIVDIKNSEDETCFAGCLALGLAQCGRWTDVEYKKI